MPKTWKNCKKVLFVALFLLSLVTPLAFVVGQTSALSGSDFQAGRIIDDGIFFNRYDMTLPQIQQFLDAKVPVCDTNGTTSKSYYYNSSTGRINDSSDTWVTTSRATYGQRYNAYVGVTYASAPYTCLKNYRQDTANRAAEAGLCDGYTASNQSAADIIYSVALSCGISPKALLVLLQKEQGLVTDDWPWGIQYRSATGFGCPDTAACDSQYYGFFNQVYSAARQFKRYAQSPNSFYYFSGRNNTILYNPSSSCGSSVVYVQNQATAGLYNYTPYQPNPGALANLSDSSAGGTAYCGAYGNRNFWWYFNRWFGSTTAFNGSIQLSSSLALTHPPTTYAYDTVSASYTVTNTASYSIDVGGLGICARLNGANFDFGFQHHVTLAANSSITISYSRQVDSPGTLKVFVCAYNEQTGWASNAYPNASSTASVREATLAIAESPFVTAGVSFSPSNPTIGQPVTVTVGIRNASGGPAPITETAVAVRGPDGKNIDFGHDTFVTIPANSVYTYSKTQTFYTPGTYSYFLASVKNGSWNIDYPKSVDGSIVRRGSLVVQDNPFLTDGVAFSPANPAIGQPVTATMSVTNTSANPVTVNLLVVAARDPFGNNVDFPAETNVTIPANSTHVYSQTRTFSTVGSHSFFVSSQRGSIWDSDYPKSVSGSIIRRGALALKDNPLVSAGISLSPASPTAGQSVTATMSITNASASPVTFNTLVIAGRGPGGINVDFPADQNLTIPANTTYVYSKSRTFSVAGSYNFFIANFDGSTWSTSYPKSSSSNIVRQLSATIH